MSAIGIIVCSVFPLLEPHFLVVCVQPVTHHYVFLQTFLLWALLLPQNESFSNCTLNPSYHL